MLLGVGDAASRQAMYADLISRGIDPNTDAGYQALLANDWYSQPYQAVAADAVNGGYYDIQCDTCVPDCHGYYPKSFLGFPSALGYKPWIGHCESGVNPQTNATAATNAALTAAHMPTIEAPPLGMHTATQEISLSPTNALDVVAPTSVQTPPAAQQQNALNPPTGSNPVSANQIVNTQPVGTNVLTQGPGATVLNQSGGFGQWISDNPALAAGLAIGALFLLGRK